MPFFLRDRSVLRVSGSDRKTFLQGLISNDIHLLSANSAIYTLLLTPQGRFLHDFFIYENKDMLLIDVHKEQVLSLEKRLKVYKLRANVHIENVSSMYAVFISFNNSKVDCFKDIVLSNPDPRLNDLGNRTIVEHQHIDSEVVSWASDDDYDLMRLTLGIPQGYQDMIPEHSIPLESGIQDLNAISWTKGCYVGQELIARTRHRGQIRKRLFPVEGAANFCKDSTLSRAIVDNTGDKVGELYSARQNRGLARLKIEALSKSLTLNGLPIIVHQPTWMRFAF